MSRLPRPSSSSAPLRTMRRGLPVRELNIDVLRRNAKPYGWRASLVRTSGLWSLGAAVLLLVARLGAGASVLGTVVAAFVVFVLANGLLAGLALVGADAFVKELQRRWGQLPLRDYLPEARAALVGDDAPQAILLLQAHRLQQRSCTLMRVQLWTGEGRARLQAVSAPQFSARTAIPTEDQVTIVDRALTPAEAQALITCVPDGDLARHVPDDEPDGVEPRIIGGTPCSLVVVARGGERMANVNLAGIPEDKRDHPTVLLMGRLWALMEIP
ncbi:MAG: hypothetical protein AB2A00_15590 [Myxococcota bacterium]